MNNSSNVNTILLVVIVVLLIGGGVWWYTAYGPGAEHEQNSGLDIQLGGSGESGNQ
jgi:hypothetical protein